MPLNWLPPKTAGSRGLCHELVHRGPLPHPNPLPAGEGARKSSREAIQNRDARAPEANRLTLKLPFYILQLCGRAHVRRLIT